MLPPETSLKKLKGHTNNVFTVAFSPDGTLLASGGNDNIVNVWDAKTGENITVFEKHPDGVRLSCLQQ